ncbi:MAG: STAS domain-containing protein [Methylococcaceae bacterium]|nr:STAS domain-containing protein [Methylococcaceae bacterium]
MSKLSIIDQGAGQLIVNSDLTFRSIDGQSVNSFAFLKAGKEITIDLSRVASADSAGLALMIEWIKYTRNKRISLHFKNIPEQLLTLAKLSGFDQSSHFVIRTNSTDVSELPS